MKINPEKIYSLAQAQKYIGVKVRESMRKYVKDGSLIALKIGEGISGGTRYAIKGEHILSFKKKYDKGLVKTEKYSTEEIKMLLNKTLEFAKEHKLTTLAEVSEKLKELK